jgi:hypothetical protein
MPKSKSLSEIEKFYIENNREKSASEIASCMPGIGEKTVETYIKSLPAKETEEETEQQRIERLASGPAAGEFIQTRSGSSVMTQSASEVSDAKRASNLKDSNKNYEKSSRNFIHKPKG